MFACNSINSLYTSVVEMFRFRLMKYFHFHWLQSCHRSTVSCMRVPNNISYIVYIKQIKTGWDSYTYNIVYIAIVDLERIITYYVHSSSAVNIETFRNNSIYIRDWYFCWKDVFIIIISLSSISYKNNTERVWFYWGYPAVLLLLFDNLIF